MVKIYPKYADIVYNNAFVQQKRGRTMRILGGQFFTSAYQTRLMQNKKSLNIQTAGQKISQQNVSLAVDAIKKEFGYTGFVVTMSDEAKEFLQSDAARIKMEQDTAQLLANSVANSDEPFSIRPRDQWSVFSEYLYKNGYFDNMSDDELQDMESMLMQITDGLDSLSMAGADWFSGVTEQLDSGEAKLELASSTAALLYFNKHFVSDDLKEGFKALIDEYYAHNAQTVSGYKSIDERFNEALAKVSEKLESRCGYMKPPIYNENNLALRKYLGGASYAEEQETQITALYTDLFTSVYDAESLENALSKATKALVSYESGGSEEQSVTDYVKNRAADTFERIGSYWSALLAA